MPQGSVLSLLLFCLYINDLKDFPGIAKVLRLLYADDLQIYIQVPATKPEIERGIQMLFDLAQIVALWAELNDLTLNPKKTKSIVFGTAHTIKLFKDLQAPFITINNAGNQTEFVNEIISLGVVLDNTLSWEAQVNRVTKKVNKALYCLKFIKPCTTQTLRKRLVQSLVMPHLYYCSVVYHDSLFSLRKCLQRLAHEGIRYIFGLEERYAHYTLQEATGGMHGDTRRESFALLILFRIVRMREPPKLLPFFTQY